MKLTSLGTIVGFAVIGLVATGNMERASAATITLYDGSSGVTPNLYNAPNQYLGFASLDLLNPFNPVVGTQMASGGKTTLDTTNRQSLYGGYSNYTLGSTLVNSSFPTLNNSAGYTLSFTMKINSQTNSSNSRAGFSVIALGSNNQGIEIGFRNSDIFSQNGSSFQVGEQTTGLGSILSSLTTYDLTISNSGYTLTNGSNTLLSGLLRNYSSAGSPYNLANFVFLGDNTTSAGASVDIKNISLITNTAAAVPEPSSMLGAAIAIGFGAVLKRQLRRQINNNKIDF